MPKVTHFEIIGRDGAKSREFYGKLFDWQIDADNPMQYGMVGAIENGIAGGIAGTEEGGAPSAMIYVEVDNCQTYLDLAVKLGGKVIVERTEVSGVIAFAQFADIDGNVIGLFESETPA